ncbi:hypothetical protein PUN28_018259 [Cardiocondyla obscurior]|uniref:Uncharacterized protein n=1 Tax=Cardiocondyla obscurior TaxID=286306 RepID=A0AAW2EL92_9HYME
MFYYNYKGSSIYAYVYSPDGKSKSLSAILIRRYYGVFLTVG